MNDNSAYYYASLIVPGDYYSAAAGGGGVAILLFLFVFFFNCLVGRWETPDKKQTNIDLTTTQTNTPVQFHSTKTDFMWTLQCNMHTHTHPYIYT